MKILLTILFTVLSTGANAYVQRGEFTSSGEYIMHYQRNDHKATQPTYGYKPHQYPQYNYNQGY